MLVSNHVLEAPQRAGVAIPRQEALARNAKMSGCVVLQVIDDRRRRQQLLGIPGKEIRLPVRRKKVKRDQ